MPEKSHYDADDNCIYMNECYDDDLYSDVFRHEFGHFADCHLGDLSLRKEFQDAVKADKKLWNPGNDNWSENIEQMMNNLVESEAVHCHYISDLFSGMFLNDSKVVEAYSDKTGLAFRGHENEYWLETLSTAPEHAIERETFANLFGVFTENDSSAVQYVQRWFPNSSRCFETILREAMDEK